MSGGGGPSAAQQQAQAEQLRIAQDAEVRELARERELKTRVLARQRARRFGQFGRRSLAFNPGRKDLGVTPNQTDTPFVADPEGQLKAKSARIDTKFDTFGRIGIFGREDSSRSRAANRLRASEKKNITLATVKANTAGPKQTFTRVSA